MALAKSKERFLGLRLFLHRYFPWLFPKLVIRDILELTVESISEHQIGALIFDYSGTLAPSLNHYPEKRVIQQLKAIINNRIPIVIVSDIYWPSQQGNIKKLAEELGCPYQICWPLPKSAYFPLRKALDTKLSGYDPTKNTAIVADGRIRDVLPGNLLGLYTVMVTEPMEGCSRIKHLRKWLGRKIKSLLFLPG